MRDAAVGAEVEAREGGSLALEASVRLLLSVGPPEQFGVALFFLGLVVVERFVEAVLDSDLDLDLPRENTDPSHPSRERPDTRRSHPFFLSKTPNV